MLTRMQATSAPTASVARGFYRRTATCKAPRKRSFLVQVCARSPRSEGAPVVGDGSNGPTGPRSPTKVCCWGDNNNDDGNGSNLFGGKQGLLAGVAAGVACALVATCPHPATAASLLEEEHSSAAASEGDFGVLPSSYSDSWLTEEERELLDPKQYRVREWVYVH